MIRLRREPELNPFPDIEPIWDNVRPVGRNHPVLALLGGHHPVSRVLDKWIRIAAFCLALCVIASSVAYAVKYDLADRFAGQIGDVTRFTVQESGFRVGDILVTGRTNTDMDALRAAIGLVRDDPILDFEPAAIRERIELLPWVHSASVERQLPDIIRIHIVERVPFAIWQRGLRFAVVDIDGVMLPPTGQELEMGLPIIIGPRVPAVAPALFEMLAEFPSIADQVKGATRWDGRRWTLHLHSGIDVLLPADDPRAAVARLERLDREYLLLDRDVVRIDLRQADRLIVTPGADARLEMGIEQDA